MRFMLFVFFEIPLCCEINYKESVSYTHPYNPSLKLAMDIAHLCDTTVEALFCYTDDEP